MLKKMTFPLFLFTLFMFASNVSAQDRTVYERIQRTYWNAHDVRIGEWLRIYPADERTTEISSLYITGHSLDRMSGGSVEIMANGRLVSRMMFNRQSMKQSAIFPFGTKISDIFIRVFGEVYVENVTAQIRERRFDREPIPAPRPNPRPRPRR